MIYFLLVALCVTPLAFGVVLYFIVARAFTSTEKTIRDLLLDNQYLRQDIAHLVGKNEKTLLPSEARLLEESETAREISPIIPLEEALAL